MASNKLAEAFIQIAPDFGGFTEKLVSGFDFAFGSAALSISESFDAAGRSMFKKFSIPLGIATAANIAQFQALEREINTVMTLFGTSGVTATDTFTELSQGVRDVAREVGGLEKDIAGGLYQAISAGVPKDSVFEFLDVAQMAAMADKAADLEVAVDGISTALNAFSAEEMTATEASDILFAGVAAGKTTFAELGGSIGRAAGLAANAGVEFAEFTAIIAEMTKSGIATSESVSYLRAALTSLLRPSEEMNAIFREIGFETAEAAVPVIGLQQSLQTLVDATGGSSTKLQELLGSAEAVSTVLAVTGENADSFDATLRRMENSAGATERAYDIMQRGIGRSFGRLTESFDQLGNIFGEMGSQIVKPIIDVVADLVSGLGEIFEDMIPMAVTLGSAMSTLMSAFDIPIIGGFAKAMLAAGFAMSGFLGVLGLVLVPLGNFIKLMFIKHVLTKFVPAVKAAASSLQVLAAGLQAVIVKGGLAGKILGGVQAAALRLVSALGTTTGALVASFGALAVAGLAVWGIVKAFTALREIEEEAARQSDIFGYGVATAMENAGLTVQDMIPAYEGVTQAAAGTRLENASLIEELKDLKSSVGDVAAADTLVQFGVSMIWQGASPEEAFTIAQEVARSTDLVLPVTLEGLSAASMDVSLLSGNVTALGQELVNWSNEAQQAYEGNDWAQEQTADTVALSDSLAQLFVAAAKQGKLDDFGDIFSTLESDIDNAVIMDTILDSMALRVEELSGGAKFGFDLDGEMQTTESFLDVMDRAIGIKEELEDDKVTLGIDTDLDRDKLVDTMNEELMVMKSMPAEINGMNVLYGEQGAVLRQLKDDTAQVFAAAREHIVNAQSAIRESLEAQIPVFGSYTAAAELSADALAKSAAAWQSDVDLVASSRQLLQDSLTDEELIIFDQKSITEQAGFLKGEVDEVESKLESFKTLVSSTDLLEEFRIDEEMGTILADANSILETGLGDLVSKAGAAGGATAQAYIDSFNSDTNGAPKWSVDAQGYVDDVEAIIGAPIAGPTISAPTFVGGSTTYTVNVTSTATKSPGTAVTRALQYAGGAHG